MTILKNQYIISDQTKIIELQSKLSLVKRENWTEIFIDSESNEWITFHPNTEYHGGGNKILYKSPIPTTENLIILAINSDYEDECEAAWKGSVKLLSLQF
ncbi:MAG: hypothetical protein EOO50_13020 [Flavobacterium sp.]|uniref:Imm27 family immunity protein n=1 Tax=Flavobacterium sp. TaxID=239 RepID=UPI00121EA1BD|nr:Imm27 family immunity protein [Flavobacterium sp.]RZJ65571.1 MAG: hypothetical protein EOO50_13020 [Flavobacterium sp.]